MIETQFKYEILWILVDKALKAETAWTVYISHDSGARNVKFLKSCNPWRSGFSRSKTGFGLIISHQLISEAEGPGWTYEVSYEKMP